MALTHEVPADRWEKVLDAFSQRNQGRPVRLEFTVQPGEGQPLLADRKPLLGVEFDPKGSEAPAIEITVGGLNAGDPDFTHVIEQPTRVWIEEDPDGLGVAMEIESREEGRTLLLFHPEPALPGSAEASGSAAAR